MSGNTGAVGRADHASWILEAHWLGDVSGDLAWHHGIDAEKVGSGEDRTVYRIGDIVYKIGTRSTANPYDHETQCEARARGCAWAPPASTLYTVTTSWGEEDTVLAMPFLVGDGSAPDPQRIAEMDEQTVSANDRAHHDTIDPGNYVVIGGQPIVIDCCTVSLDHLRSTCPRIV